jgi:predicted dienelactone hydrolase
MSIYRHIFPETVFFQPGDTFIGVPDANVTGEKLKIMPAGFMTLRTVDKNRSRPLFIDLWYPAAADAEEKQVDYGPGSGRAAPDALPVEEAQPVIVLSHAAFGSARGYSWIAEGLARRGFVVAGVSHFGESPVFGLETVDPSATLQPWQRPLDCSAALDFILAEPRLEKIADPGRIAALGHSTGGATVIALAGAVFDSEAMRDYCASAAARSDKGCLYAAAGRPPGAEDAARRSYRDERIRAAVVMDPALGPGHDARSLSGIRIPIHVIGAVENDFLPFEHHAGRYARLIPGASLTPLAHGEGHFVFLDECSGDRELQGVPLCRDREGVQRASVHARLIETITRFFLQHL